MLEDDGGAVGLGNGGAEVCREGRSSHEMPIWRKSAMKTRPKCAWSSSVRLRCGAGIGASASAGAGAGGCPDSMSAEVQGSHHQSDRHDLWLLRKKLGVRQILNCERAIS